MKIICCSNIEQKSLKHNMQKKINQHLREIYQNPYKNIKNKQVMKVFKLIYDLEFKFKNQSDDVFITTMRDYIGSIEKSITKRVYNLKFINDDTNIRIYGQGNINLFINIYLIHLIHIPSIFHNEYAMSTNYNEQIYVTKEKIKEQIKIRKNSLISCLYDFYDIYVNNNTNNNDDHLICCLLDYFGNNMQTCSYYKIHKKRVSYNVFIMLDFINE